MEKQKTVTVNGEDVRVHSEGNIYYIPIAHVCNALGIDYSSQHVRILRNPMLINDLVKKTMLANDGVMRQMICLPAHFALGWLFSLIPIRIDNNKSKALQEMLLEAYNNIYELMTNEKELEAKVEKLTTIIERYEKEKEWTEFGVDLED